MRNLELDMSLLEKKKYLINIDCSKIPDLVVGFHWYSNQYRDVFEALEENES